MNLENIHSILKKYWGFDSFRDTQEKIILEVLSGKDTLALLPTGGGKSICYQVPGMMNEGICLVISPLIALMEDQVNNLNKIGIKARLINSGMSKRAIDIELDNAIYGNTKFLYVSPERLRTKLFIERLKKMKINLIAVDEAHCISQWGYDFRPAYLKIADLRELLPSTPVLALTATATLRVVDDIQEKLHFKAKNCIRRTFFRENLTYSTYLCDNKRNRIEEYLNKSQGSGIIYCSTRKSTKDLYKHLSEKKFSVDYYHGGLDYETRKKKQADWINNKTRVIISTNAFGMGIDKPDVRFVLHYEIPETIEAYFQEAGRAGRDEQEAEALLFFEKQDIRQFTDRAALKFPSLDLVRNVYKALGNHFQLAIGSGEGETYSLELGAFCEKYGFQYLETYNCLKLLETADYLSLSEGLHQPSKLMILADKKSLYEQQTGNESINRIIQFILRTEMNAFETYVNFNQYKLSQTTGISEKEISRSLQHLNDLELIDFVPATNLPQITYIHERLNEINLEFPPEIYSERKKIHESRTEAVIEYLDGSNCRSVYLLSYFDENNSAACGKCSFCLDHSESKETSNLRSILSAYFSIEFKESKAVSIEKIIVQFEDFPREEVLETLRWMIDHQMVSSDDSGKTILPA